MRATRAVLVVLGLCAMGYAVAGAARAPAIVPGKHLAFLLAVLVVHDVVWMPSVLAAGALVRATVPARARAHVQAALIVSASVAAVAWPLVPGRGRAADNPSVLPRDYPAGLAITIAATWLAAAILVAVAAYGRRRSSIQRSAEQRGAGHRAGDDDVPRGGD